MMNLKKIINAWPSYSYKMESFKPFVRKLELSARFGIIELLYQKNIKMIY